MRTAEHCSELGYPQLLPTAWDIYCGYMDGGYSVDIVVHGK